MNTNQLNEKINELTRQKRRVIRNAKLKMRAHNLQEAGLTPLEISRVLKKNVVTVKRWLEK